MGVDGRVGGEKGWGWGVNACVEGVGAGGRVGVGFLSVWGEGWDGVYMGGWYMCLCEMCIMIVFIVITDNPTTLKHIRERKNKQINK